MLAVSIDLTKSSMVIIPMKLFVFTLSQREVTVNNIILSLSSSRTKSSYCPNNDLAGIKSQWQG